MIQVLVLTTCFIQDLDLLSFHIMSFSRSAFALPQLMFDPRSRIAGVGSQPLRGVTGVDFTMKGGWGVTFSLSVIECL